MTICLVAKESRLVLSDKNVVLTPMTLTGIIALTNVLADLKANFVVRETNARKAWLAIPGIAVLAESKERFAVRIQTPARKGWFALKASVLNAELPEILVVKMERFAILIAVEPVALMVFVGLADQKATKLVQRELLV